MPRREDIARDLHSPTGSADASLRQRANAAYQSRSLINEILLRLRLRSGDTILDVGCGSGEHLEVFRERVSAVGVAIGLDFAPDAVCSSREKGLSVVLGDACTLPFCDDFADAIGCNYAIYYFADLQMAVAELRRVLKRSGRLVLTGPAHGTNAELYEFHRNATGHGPSDADLMAIGYLGDHVAPELGNHEFGAIREETITNKIVFPSAQAFLEYWRATSLFKRTIPESARESVMISGAQLFSAHTGGFVVTKRVSILSSGCE